MRKNDRDKFVRLATKRVSSSLKSMQLVGNLSNKSNYDYAEGDVSKIFKALQDELNACKRRFELATQARTKSVFTID